MQSLRNAPPVSPPHRVRGGKGRVGRAGRERTVPCPIPTVQEAVWRRAVRLPLGFMKEGDRAGVVHKRTVHFIWTNPYSSRPFLGLTGPILFDSGFSRLYKRNRDLRPGRWVGGAPCLCVAGELTLQVAMAAQ